MALPLHGEEVSLRALEIGDAAAVAALVSDPEVIKQTISMTTPFHEGEAERWIRQELEVEDQKHRVLVVEEVRSKALVGTVSVHVKRRFLRRWGTIGYWIGKPYWGRGYGTQALKAFVPYCFDVLEISRFQARVFESNQASQRVLENNGFRRTGRIRLFVPKRGGWRRILLYRLKKPS
ncbi:MAG: N-acetyltransferase [Alphaproteobacteria bacterium]|nr:MAG: N-acetyltransferase [Alphaproteobacteria bacterium]